VPGRPRGAGGRDRRMIARMAAVQIGVVGPGDGATADDVATAHRVGLLLGRAGATVVCGGLGGVMAAACAGAREAGGLTVGLLPGDDPRAGNAHLTVAIPTGIGEMRNVLVLRAARALIGIGGSFGTLSELAHANRAGRPVTVIRPPEVRFAGDAAPTPLGHAAADADEAVAWALAAAVAG
jgi:uncharacterized protein (TIGR00725 family)